MAEHTVSSVLVGLHGNDNTDCDNFGLHGFSRFILKMSAMENGETPTIRTSISTLQ